MERERKNKIMMRVKAGEELNTEMSPVSTGILSEKEATDEELKIATEGIGSGKKNIFS